MKRRIKEMNEGLVLLDLNGLDFGMWVNILECFQKMRNIKEQL